MAKMAEVAEGHANNWGMESTSYKYKFEVIDCYKKL